MSLSHAYLFCFPLPPSSLIALQKTDLGQDFNTVASKKKQMTIVTMSNAGPNVSCSRKRVLNRHVSKGLTKEIRSKQLQGCQQLSIQTALIQSPVRTSTSSDAFRVMGLIHFY